MTNSSLVFQAAILGTIAFNSGKKAVPIHDKALVDLLKIPGADILAILTAWTDSWHAANIAQNVVL